jgi:hypothetical protein
MIFAQLAASAASTAEEYAAILDLKETHTIPASPKKAEIPCQEMSAPGNEGIK